MNSRLGVTATVGMGVLLSAQEAGRPRVSNLAMYKSGTPQVRHLVVVRWHAHLHGLSTVIHEMSGLNTKLPVESFFLAL